MMDLQRKKSWQEKGVGWGWWRGFLMLECPQGHRNRISLEPDGHKVGEDGSVSPSCVCPGDGKIGGTPGCTFHEFVKLIGWQGDESEKDEVGP